MTDSRLESPGDSRHRSDEAAGAKRDAIPQALAIPVEPMPAAFQCVVYVRNLDGGGVAARVANFGKLEATAATEREAITRLLPMAKAFVQAYHAEHGRIPDDELRPMEDGEQRRRLPAHL